MAVDRLTLYKTDSKGKTRVINMWTEGHEIVQSSGLLTGKLVVHRTPCTAKNVGKSNETTPEAQAVKEMEAKYKLKQQEGYYQTIEDAQAQRLVLPMLAKSYVFGKDKGNSKVDWTNAYAQPKLDGMRALIFFEVEGVKIMSRKGVPITSVPHIIDDLSGKNIPAGIVLDGELYAHGLSFQENMRLTKKNRGEASEVIKFHCYDMIMPEAFPARGKSSAGFINSLIKQGANTIEKVPSYKVRDHNALIELHDKWVKEGYEGAMLRQGSEEYKIDGRSSQLLKVKVFDDANYVIKDVIPTDRRPDHARLVFEHEGVKFMAAPKCSHALKASILINKEHWIGQEIVVRYFGLTDGEQDGSGKVPRFPVALVPLP